MQISTRCIMKKIALVLIVLTFSGCFISAGTLGGFKAIDFPVSKRKLVSAIDSLYKSYPEYKIPDKWKSFDDWHARGYDFLDSRIFYFKLAPEEMYYISFIGDANNATQTDTTLSSLSIRAVFNDAPKWLLEQDFNSVDKERIQKRFYNEIITKLEYYTKSKSIQEN